jgi:hypothetical protein
MKAIEKLTLAELYAKLVADGLLHLAAIVKKHLAKGE